MRFVILVKASKDSEAGVLPSADLLNEMGKFNEQLVKDGVMLAGEGLKPTSEGKRLRFDGGRTTIIDGPFAETKELVAGFWIVQGKSKEEIVERFTHAPFYQRRNDRDPPDLRTRGLRRDHHPGDRRPSRAPCGANEMKILSIVTIDPTNGRPHDDPTIPQRMGALIQEMRAKGGAGRHRRTRHRHARALGRAQEWPNERHRRPVCRIEGSRRRVRPHGRQGSRRCDRLDEALPRRPRHGNVPSARGFADAIVSNGDPHGTIAAIWRIESPKLIASLSRMLRDVGRAEDLAQDAFVAALSQWPDEGIPRNPGAWLMTAAKRRAIDQIRRDETLHVSPRAPRCHAELVEGCNRTQLCRLLRGNRRRHAALDVRRLPSGRVEGSARRADAQTRRRFDDGRDRACLSRSRNDDRAAHRSCKAHALGSARAVRGTVGRRSGCSGSPRFWKPST